MVMVIVIRLLESIIVVRILTKSVLGVFMLNG